MICLQPWMLGSCVTAMLINPISLCGFNWLPFCARQTWDGKTNSGGSRWRFSRSGRWTSCCQGDRFTFHNDSSLDIAYNDIVLLCPCVFSVCLLSSVTLLIVLDAHDFKIGRSTLSLVDLNCNLNCYVAFSQIKITRINSVDYNCNTVMYEYITVGTNQHRCEDLHSS